MTDKKIGIFRDKCPKCKSDDLSYDAYEPVDEQFIQGASCGKCGYSFTLWAMKPVKWEIWGEPFL